MKRTDIKKYRVPVALAAALVGAGLVNGKFEKVQGLDYAPSPALPPAYVEPLEPVVKAPATVPELFDQEEEKERRARKIDLSFRTLRDYFLGLFRGASALPEVSQAEALAPVARPAAATDGFGTITISAPGFHLVTREEEEAEETVVAEDPAPGHVEEKEERAPRKSGGLALAFALTLLATVFWPLPRLSAKIKERFNVTKNFRLLSLFSKLLTVLMVIGVYFLVPQERRGWISVFAVLWGVIMLTLSVLMLRKRESEAEAEASVNGALETEELAV